MKQISYRRGGLCVGQLQVGYYRNANAISEILINPWDQPGARNQTIVETPPPPIEQSKALLVDNKGIDFIGLQYFLGWIRIHVSLIAVARYRRIEFEQVPLFLRGKVFVFKPDFVRQEFPAADPKFLDSFIWQL